MKQVCLLFILLIMLLSSCGFDVKEPDGNENNNHKFEILTVEIIQPDFPLADWYRISHAQEMGNESFFFGYNQKMNQLEVYNLAQKKFHKVIKFKTEGPDALSELYSLFVFNWDSIFILGLRKVMLIDSSGRILFNQPINLTSVKANQIEGINFKDFAFYSTGENMQPIHYQPPQQKLFLATKSMKFSEKQKEYYQQSLFGYLDFRQKKYFGFPVSFPEKFQGNRYPNHLPNLSFLANEVVFNFPFSSEVFLYRVDTGISKFFDVPSSYSKNQGEPLTFDPAMDHYTVMLNQSRNPTFFRIIYDPNSKLYYRFHFADYKGDIPSGSPPQRGAMYLTAMDLNFNKILEVEIEEHFYDGQPTPDGLMIQWLGQKPENVFKFSYYKVL